MTTIMHAPPAPLLLTITLALLLPAAATDPAVTGSAPFQFRTVPGWDALPDGGPLGNTHGEPITDKAGNVYITTDGDNSVVVLAADGSLQQRFGYQWKGMHGFDLVEEDGTEFLYGAHLAGRQVVKLTLGGALVWHIGLPEESGLYQNRGEYKPTDVAVGPDGRIYIADGYGHSVIHIYSPDRKYLKTFGKKGTGDGEFTTCHNITIDTRHDPPRLLVSDRDNSRLQYFDLDGNFIKVFRDDLRRPCTVAIRGEFAAVAEIQGRVTILDGNDEIVTHLGDNPDQSQWANNPIPPEEWKEGVFTAPHGLDWGPDGSLYVMDWNATGRVSKLVPVATTAGR